MEKIQGRVKSLRNSKYCTHKQAAAGHTEKKLKAALKKLKAHKGLIRIGDVKKIAHEAGTVLYSEMSHPTKRPTWASLEWKLLKKFKRSDSWLYTQFRELIQDPHLGKALQLHYGHHLKKKPAPRRLNGDRVEILFQRLDEANKLVGLYDEKGKPKALNTIDKALRKKGEPGNLGTMYPMAKNKREWRVWRNAVEEWKQSRAEDENQ
ncbi:MAG: hypothetical protein KAW41_06090 [Candidatus Diapherotrites archaeon]|nr:hypothetical protein [Candidatus Diapherotrites archaeon]